MKAPSPHLITLVSLSLLVCGCEFHWPGSVPPPLRSISAQKLLPTPNPAQLLPFHFCRRHRNKARACQHPGMQQAVGCRTWIHIVQETSRKKEQTRPGTGCPLSQRGAGVFLLGSDQAAHWKSNNSAPRKCHGFTSCRHGQQLQTTASASP